MLPLSSSVRPHTTNMVWRVRKRQSTFWDFESPEHTQRVHFIGKLEHHFVSNYAEDIEITDDHPVLVNYQHPWTEIYIAAKPARPGELAVELLQAVQSQLDGWRAPAEYFNRDVAPRKLLEGGYGLLFSGPEPLAAVVRQTLSAAEVRFTSLPRKRLEHQARALVAGTNFVVARDFRNEA
jgi:hypothetical protein